MGEPNELAKYSQLVKCLEEAKKLAGEIKEELDGIKFPVVQNYIPSYSVDEICREINQKKKRSEEPSA